MGLRIMLTICESFASSCGLCFNPLKTQLIRFHLFDKGSVIDKFIFCGLVLQVVTSVIHLGNKLTHNLSDDDDVLLKTSSSLVESGKQSFRYLWQYWPNSTDVFVSITLFVPVWL